MFMATEPTGEIPNFIRRLLPTATEQELDEATGTFKQYMAVVLERIELDSSDQGMCDRVRNVDHTI